MKKIKWKKKYEVGNYEIDAEHKLFVRIIQKFADSLTNKADNYYIERLINELLKYAEFHFYSEETIMIEIEYPDIIRHKQEHEKLLEQMRNMVMIVEMDDEKIYESDYTNFLLNWFVNHTIKQDQKLAKYINLSKNQQSQTCKPVQNLQDNDH